ncbi:mechanosensitive ion channel protein MscS [Cupriavidus sp. NPDC089707]|uniref:mechanosensitive ion channel protein MscS n=1 Tax=Cupriavidus sp. NPDC089707 TaxID=3363963 RepID=UPI003810E854
MRPSTRIVAAAALTVALVAAGPTSARGRHHGGGSNAGAVLAVGALVGLAFGAALASAPVVAAPVAVAPPPVTYAPAPVSYAPPAVPPGYCYRDYDRVYVPCGPQPSGYYQQAPYYGY